MPGRWFGRQRTWTADPGFLLFQIDHPNERWCSPGDGAWCAHRGDPPKPACSSADICMVFEYLTVLVSVVVGLTATPFLTNVVRIIHVRGNVRISWEQLLWSVTILIWTVAFWWFTFVLARQSQWTFPLFVLLLAYATLLYVLMALLFPEGVPPDHDYRAQFMRNRVWSFGVFALFPCVDLVDYVIKLDRDVSIVGHL